MSFMIKGIDLPKEGEAVELFVMSDGQVYTKFIRNSRVAYMGEAEAIQIPTPHGRLIDGDELNKSVHKWNPVFTYGRSAFTREIGNAPTILEAEE